MAIIYSYPLNDDIKPLDELVGTTEKSINGQLKTVTRNFLLSDLAEFFMVNGGIQKTITLTTNNTSGPATLNQTTGILNIPNYSESTVGTNLSPTQTAINFTINSSTGTGATIPLGNGVLAGATLNDYTTAEKTKLAGIAPGAEVNVNADWNATSGDALILNKPVIPSTAGFLPLAGGNMTGTINWPSQNGAGLNWDTFTDGASIRFYTTSDIDPDTRLEFNIKDNQTEYFRWTAQPSTIPSTPLYEVMRLSPTALGAGNAILTVSGKVIANSFEKLGGTSSQILAANGSVITAGTNITISGGTISSSGGGGSSPLTTKGDLYTFSTVDARLPIGADGQILTANSGVPEGLSWQDNYADWTSTVKHIVKNNGLSGTITKGTAVYVTSSNGTNMLVGKASNVSEPTSSKTMGLMQSDITTTGGTQTGFVITEGLLGGLNTDGATAGDPVWLGVDGALIYGLINKPYAPNHLAFIGIVTKVSAGNGEIFVKVQNGFELKELHDVQAQNPTLKDTLYYDNTVSPAQWKTASIPTVLGYTPQDTLQNTVNIKSINGNSILGSGDLTINPSTPSQSAFTILANNTNASAVPAEQVYKEVAQQSLSGTGMIATGGALPTGTNTHFYRWSQVGNLITVRINLQFQTAGTCSGIAIPFANMPDIPQIPQHPNIYATALDMITFGSGSLASNKLIGTFAVGSGMSGIRIKTIGTPNTYEIVVGRASGSYNNGWIHVQYYI